MGAVRAVVGVVLTALAAVAACVFLLADRIVVWRTRWQSRNRAAELKRKVQAARAQADAQRAAVVEAEAKRVADQLEQQKQADPVDAANAIIEESRRADP